VQLLRSIGVAIPFVLAAILVALLSALLSMPR